MKVAASARPYEVFVRLYNIIKDYPLLAFSGSAQTEVLSLTYDSRRVLEGSLFVCLKGERMDGHAFIAEALSRKASALLIQTELSAEQKHLLAENYPQIAVARVADTREALSYLSRQFYPRGEDDLQLQLILGNFGKSSCAHMLYQAGRSLFGRAALLDGMCLMLDGENKFAGRNHPEASDIAALLSQVADIWRETPTKPEANASREEPPCGGYFLLPLSYNDIRLKRGRFSQPCAALLLQAGEEDLRLSMAQLGECQTLLFNADGVDNGALAAQKGLLPPMLSFGIEQSADIRARALKIKRQGERIGTDFWVDFPDGQSVDFFIGLPSRHQVQNALALISWAWRLGCSPEKLQKILPTLTVPGHGEVVEIPGLPFTLLIDSAWAAPQLQQLLGDLRPYCRRRLLLVLGTGGDRDRAARQVLAQTAAELADHVWFTVSHPRSEGAAAIVNDMRDALPSGTLPQDIDCEPDRERAISLAVQAARPGDLVVLTGKAEEDYSFGAREAVPFSDYEVARRVCLECYGELSHEK